MGKLTQFRKIKQLSEGSESYLTTEEKKMMLDQIHSLYKSEYLMNGALKNYRLVTEEDLPKVELIKLQYSDGEIIFYELPEGINELFVCFDKMKLQICTFDPSAIRISNPLYQVYRISNPQLGIPYAINEDSEVDMTKIHVYEKKYELYNKPWNTRKFDEVKGSRIDIYLMRSGFMRINLFHLDDVHNVVFRKSKKYENAFDLLIDYGQVSLPGDYRLNRFEDRLIVCDPVLHSALMNQASIYTIGTPMEGKFVYRVSLCYVDAEGYSDAFVDADKYMNISNAEYNRSLFSDV